MTDNSRPESTQDMFNQADAVFTAEVAKLVLLVRGLIKRGVDPQQAGADLQAFIGLDMDPSVVAACLAQAVRRIVDLEDLVSL